MRTAKLKARTVIGLLAIGAVVCWGVLSGLRGGSSPPASAEPSSGAGAPRDEGVSPPASVSTSRLRELASTDGFSNRSSASDEAAPIADTEVRLLVVDPAQRPIEGAVANTPDLAVWPIPESNEEGIVVLELDGPWPERLIAKAYGFQEASVDLPPDLNEPLVVTLEPWNRLRLRIVTDSPAWTDRLTLVLRSPGKMFRSVAHSLGFYDAGTDPLTYGFPAGGTRATFDVGPEGVIDIEALAVGVAIEAAVVDCRGRVLHSELLPERTDFSRQEVVIALSGAAHSWSGRIVDEAGSPVVGAEVRVTWDGVEDLIELPCEPGRTDASGSFRVDELWADRGELIVTPAEHLARKRERDRALARGLALVACKRWSSVDLRTTQTFTLDSGRAFTVFVREEAGKRVSGADFWLLDDAQRSARIEKFTEGRYEVHGAPLGDCRVRLEVGGRSYERIVAAAQDELVITVPVHGLVEVSIAGDLDQSLRDRHVVFESGSPDLSRAELRIRRHGWKEVWTVPIFRALPGAYEARIVERAADGQFALLSDTVPVQVIAGEKVQVLLTPALD